MSKRATRKIVSGLQNAVAYAKIDALWRQTKKEQGEEINQYDWGYRDGLFAARALFGQAVVTDPFTPGEAESAHTRARIRVAKFRADKSKGKSVSSLRKKWMEDPAYRKAFKKAKPVTKRKPTTKRKK